MYAQYYLDKYVLQRSFNTQTVEALECQSFLVNWRADSTILAITAEERCPCSMRGRLCACRAISYSKEPFPQRRGGLVLLSASRGRPWEIQTTTSQSLILSVCKLAYGCWRGLAEHSHCVRLTSETTHDEALVSAATRAQTPCAKEMRSEIQASLEATLSLSSPQMKQANCPIHSDDPTIAKGLEAVKSPLHARWFLADWGDAALNLVT